MRSWPGRTLASVYLCAVIAIVLTRLLASSPPQGGGPICFGENHTSIEPGQDGWHCHNFTCNQRCERLDWEDTGCRLTACYCPDGGAQGCTLIRHACPGFTYWDCNPGCSGCGVKSTGSWPNFNYFCSCP